MRCGSMKAVIFSETNAHDENIPPVFQQWHAAKAIEGNLGDHARSSQNIKSSIAGFCEVRE